MADSTVDDLTAASALDGTEEFYAVQGGADRKVTGTQIKTFATAGLSSDVTIDTTVITGGTTARLLYDNGATVGEALIRYSAANLFMGGVDAASPTAQTISPQNVATGTSNTAGADWTFSGSKGTGTGAGGNIVFKTAALGGAGSSQNALTTSLTVKPDSMVWSNSTGATGTFRTSSGALLIDPSDNVVAIANKGQLWLWNISGSDPSILFGGSQDLILSRSGAAALQLGAADAAAPVAQTTTVQSVVAGTSNTAGTDWTISGSKGTGTGAGGSIIFKTAAAAGSGNTQNALATILTLPSTGIAAFAGAITTAGTTVGYLNVPQNSRSANYTTVAADSGKHIFHPAADVTARDFTIDSNANVPYALGTVLTFVNQNAGGVITIKIATDVMRLAGAGTTGDRTLAANGIATAIKVATAEWLISGTGLT